MARIAFLLLCHKDPDGVAAQVRRLTAAGDCVAVHYDARAPRAEFDRIREELDGLADVAFAPRVKCGWGEWSLVAATLNAARSALAAFPDATHLYLISGDCLPVKSSEQVRGWLDDHDVDLIECHDLLTSGWIRTGLVAERIAYRHYFNERTRKRSFYAALGLQEKLGLTRRPPKGIDVAVGSQWWCLRRGTVERFLDLMRRRPDIVRFFRTTWIPDEAFFQTLARHVVPAAEIENRPPTFVLFTDYGMPVVFHDDHADLLQSEPAFFARKIAPGARRLRARLGAIYSERGLNWETARQGRRLYEYLASRGRDGRRTPARAWEDGSSVGRGREILAVVCKKWHTGNGLRDRMTEVTGIPSVGYLFDEESAELPEMGGLELGLEKRRIHRRAFLRTLFDTCDARRIILCSDPANLDLLEDLAQDEAELRVLDVRCRMTDDWLKGHAERIGIAGGRTSDRQWTRILTALRTDIAEERRRIRLAPVSAYAELIEEAPLPRQCAALASFLSISDQRAAALLDEPARLFAD